MYQKYTATNNPFSFIKHPAILLLDDKHGGFMITVKDVGVNIQIVVKTDSHDKRFLAFSETELMSILLDLGVTVQDVQYMLQEFEMRGHNHAEFGFYKGFTFSKFEGVAH